MKKVTNTKIQIKNLAYICLYCTDLSEVTKALPLCPLDILVVAKSSLLILL